MKNVDPLDVGASRARVCLLLALAVLAAPARVLVADGLAALRTADPACPDDSGNVYVDCGNGTVTDNRTGLVWLRDAGCVSSVNDWRTAEEFAAGLSDLESADDCGLTDGSSPGDWRLPSKTEWEQMVADADGGPGELDCDPVITNDQGTACWDATCSGGGTCVFTGIQSASYWSGTTTTGVAANAWFIFLSSGFTPSAPKDQDRLFWMVRDGQ